MVELILMILTLMMNILELIIRTFFLFLFVLIFWWAVCYLSYLLSKLFNVNIDEDVLWENSSIKEQLKTNKWFVAWLWISIILFVMAIVEIVSLAPKFYHNSMKNCELKYFQKEQIEIWSGCEDFYYDKIKTNEEKLNKEMKLREHWFIKD